MNSPPWSPSLEGREGERWDDLMGFNLLKYYMKKGITIFIILISVFFIKEVDGQRILGALSAGVNATQVDGDELYGFKHYGFNIGPSVIIPFTKSKKWSVTMELLFSQYGSYEKYADIDTLPRPYYKLNLDYVQIPVLVHFTDKNIVAGGVGFSYGQLVAVSEWEHGQRTETNLQGPYKKNDFNVLADVKIKLWQRLWFNFRYAYSMVKIRTRVFHDQNHPLNPAYDWTRDQYNNVLTFRLTYVFNQEIIYKKQTKPKGH
jgi:hypothetical protein